MEHRALGRTGIAVSVLGFGCGAVGGLMVLGDAAEQRRAVACAIDAGVTYFDTAAQYGNGRSEENLGRTLGELGAWDRVTVGTKARLDVAGRGELGDALRRSLVASLRRLGRDSIDLLQLHNPIVADGSELELGLNQSDVLGEIGEGLRELVAEGLTRHVGFTATGDPSATKGIIESRRLETMQAYFNALNPSAAAPGICGDAQDFDGIITEAGRRAMGVIAIRVLAAGAIGGSAERAVNASDPGRPLVHGGDFERDLQRSRAFKVLVDGFGLESAEELAFRFALWPEEVSTALVGFSNMDQLEQALRWAERGRLPEDLVQRVLELPR